MTQSMSAERPTIVIARSTSHIQKSHHTLVGSHTSLMIKR